MPNKERLNKALTKHQQAWISNWNQGGRDDVGEGICMGMCLDWVRRILNRRGSFGTPQNPTSVIYNEATDASFLPWKNVKEKRFEMQKTTHKMMRMTQQLNVGNILESELQKMITAFEFTRGRSPTQDESVELAIRLYRRNIPKLMREAYATFKVQWALGTSKTVGLWSKTSKPKKRNFDQIEIDTDSISKFTSGQDITGLAFFDSYLAAAIQILRVNSSAGILSVGKTTSSGHDLAFFAPFEGGAVYFFDPNLGEFRFNYDLVDLRDFWTELWDSVYAERHYTWALLSRFYWKTSA